MTTEATLIEVGRALLPYLREGLTHEELGAAAFNATAAVNRTRARIASPSPDVNYIAEIIGANCCQFERTEKERSKCRALKSIEDQKNCYCLDAARAVLAELAAAA